MELGVGDEEGAYLYSIFCKVKNRIQWRKQVIQSDQDVHVCGIFLAVTRAPFCMTLSFIWDMGYLSCLLFFFFSFFYTSRHRYTPFFCTAHIFLQDEYQSHVKGTEHFFGEWEACFLRNFHCRSQHMSGQVGKSR